MRASVLAGLLIASTLVASPARAEDVVSIEAEGDADTSGGDPRTAALDEAFAAAIATAVTELVPADVRAAHRADIEREIVGRARLWVVKFTVSKDTTSGDRRQLVVAVRVDRDKMLARLDELGIGTKLATVLLRVQDPTSTRATFGQGGERDVPGLAALTSTLRKAGMQVKRAPTTGASAKGDGGLPLSDDDAAALAKEVNADIAAIAGVSVSTPVPARGVAADVVGITASVRIVDRRASKLVGQGSATAAATGSEATVVTKAIERALLAATGDVFPSAAPSLGTGATFTGADMPLAEAGVVLVRLGSRTPWGLVAAELKYLQGAKGIKRAVLRRLSPNGWVIGCATSESVDRIAQIAKKPPSADTSVKVKVTGDIVELTLAGAP